MNCTKIVVGNCVKACFVGLCLAAHSASAAVVAFWEFEPGNLTVDSTVNAHTLTNTGVTSSLDVPGTSSSGSASFNGTTAFMNTASTLNLSSENQLTIEFFYKPSGNFASDADIFFEHSSNFNSFAGGIVGSGNYTGSMNQINGGYNPSGYLIDVANSAPVAGWHHVAFEFDRAAASPAANSDVVKIYVDYALAGADTMLNNNRMAFLNDTFFLGSRNGTQFHYDGLIDQFRISNTLLAPGQFLQANAPVVIPAPEPGSLALLAFGTVLLRRVSRRQR